MADATSGVMPACLPVSLESSHGSLDRSGEPCCFVGFRSWAGVAGRGGDAGDG